ARADENRVVIFGKELLHAVDTHTEAPLDPEIEDQVDLFLEYADGEPECGNLAAHHAATDLLLLVDHHLVTERQQVARHRERGGAGADAGDALAVFLFRNFGQELVDLTAIVGGDAL